MDAERLERAARALLGKIDASYGEDGSLVSVSMFDSPDACDAVLALRAALDAAQEPAQAGEAVAYEIIDAAGRHVAVRRTLQAAKSWVRAGTGWTVRPLVPAPSRPGGA